jgi:hypothetical protein
LQKKESAGTITTKEVEELRKLYRYRDFSPAIIDLWERTERHDPLVEQVQMWQGKEVVVKKGDTQEKILWTYGLAGCLAVAIFTEDQAGVRTGILTHYPPTRIPQNISTLHSLFNKNFALKEQTTKRSVLIVAEERYQQNPQTGAWIAVVDKQANVLTSAIKNYIGEDLLVQIKSYSSAQIIGAQDQGILILKVPPIEKGKATVMFASSTEKILSSPSKF